MRWAEKTEAPSLGFHQVFSRETLPPASAAHCWRNVSVKVASVSNRFVIHVLLGIKNRFLPLPALTQGRDAPLHKARASEAEMKFLGSLGSRGF